VSEITDYLLVGEYPRDHDIEWLRNEHRVTAIHNLQDDEDLRINALDIAVLREVSAHNGIKLVRTPIQDGSADDMADRLRAALSDLAVLVEGRERFRLVELTKGRSFHTAEVESVEDDGEDPDPGDVERALEQFSQLKEITESEVEDPELDAGQLSFQLAARVDFGAEVKQQLLEQQSEAKRMRVLAELLAGAVQTMALEREVRDRASQNGKVETGRVPAKA